MAQIKILLFPDVLPWEKKLFEPMIPHFAKHHSVEVLPYQDSMRKQWFKAQTDEETIFWFWAGEWRQAIRAVELPPRSRVFTSVLRLKPQRTSLPALFLKSFKSELPLNASVICYSPLNYRFFLEMDNLTHERVKLLPLPFPRDMTRRHEGASDHPVTVGTFAPFIGESNLHYFLNVAHYVHRHRPEVRFRILGAGPLEAHLNRVVEGLGLANVVQILQTNTLDTLTGLDIFLNVSLRNDHFGPLFLAAGARIPVLASEVAGIEDILTDGSTGFITPVHQTKPMGELVLRLADSAALRYSLADKLFAALDEKYSYERIVRLHETILFGEKAQSVAGEAAA